VEDSDLRDQESAQGVFLFGMRAALLNYTRLRWCHIKWGNSVHFK